MDNTNFDNESINELPFENRPQLRFIDKKCRPNCINLSKRLTVVLMVNIGITICTASRFSDCLLQNHSWEHVTNDQSEEISNKNQLKLKTILHMDGLFFIGSILIQIPCGILCYKYSSTTIFGVSLLFSSSLSLLVSIVGGLSQYILWFYAFLQGLIQGGLIIMVYGILRHWTPSSERATLISLSYSGVLFGSLIGYVISNTACPYFYWTSILTWLSVAGIIWYFLWIWLVFEHPSKHPTIMDSEYLFLQQYLVDTTQYKPIPWKQLLVSKPLYTLASVYCCRSFYTVYVSELEYAQWLFINPMNRVNVDKTLLLAVIGMPTAGYFSDLLLRRTEWSVLTIRKLFIYSALLIRIIDTLIYLIFVEYADDFYIHLIGAIFYAISTSAIMANVIDVSRHFSCVVFAIINLINMVVLWIPIEKSLYDFSEHYYPITAGIILILMDITEIILYHFFGSCDVQNWAKPDNHQSNETVLNSH